MDQPHVQFLLLFFMVGVQSSGKMTILLLNYRNPNHQVFNGDCCDNLNFCSWNDCDNLFKFCATAVGSTDPCALSGGQLTTQILGDDDFWFPGQGGYLGGGLTNPLTFPFQEWKGVSLVVEVWDDDGGFIVGRLADLVDKYTLIETTAPNSNKSSSRPRDKRLCGKRSCTNVKIRVYCDDSYLVPECTEYCVSRDNDEKGHYWCDYELGKKVCHEGWYDVDTNCTKKKKECTPRNDTIRGHYDCDPESGEKICWPGWMGSNCTQVHVSYSVMASSSSRGTNKEMISMHPNTIWGPSFTSATSKEIHPTPSNDIQPTPSNDIEYSRTNLEDSADQTSSPPPPATTQNVEHASAFVSVASTIFPSVFLYSTTSKLQHSTVAVTKEKNDYATSSSSSSFVREHSSFNLIRTSGLHSPSLALATIADVGSYAIPSSTRLQYTTREMAIDFSTTAVGISVTVSSSIGGTLRVPTTEWSDELVLNVGPAKNVSIAEKYRESFMFDLGQGLSELNHPAKLTGIFQRGPFVCHIYLITLSLSYLLSKWTEGKKDKLKSAITDQVNKYCSLQPRLCNVDTNVTSNRTEYFNSSDVVVIVVKNRTSANTVSVSVNVKLPSTIPGLSGGGTLSSVVVKKVITESKKTIEKQVGLAVSLETTLQPTKQPTTTTTASSSITRTQPAIQPTITTTTTDSVAVTVNTSYSSFTPWNLWIYIVGSCVACLLILGATLGFLKSKINRQNKIHPFDNTPERTETMAKQEEQELICLSNTQPLISKNKNTLKVKLQDTVLRVRTSSVNSDKSVLYSPFTPNYTGS